MSQKVPIFDFNAGGRSRTRDGLEEVPGDAEIVEEKELMSLLVGRRESGIQCVLVVPEY